jgi:hypothetical protein
MPFKNYILTKGGQLVRTFIRSPNFVHGSTGWTINKDGSAEFHNIILPSGSGGNVIILSASTPSGTGITAGDLWFDLTNGQVYVWNGASWGNFQYGTGAIANGAVTPTQISNLTATLVGYLGVLNANPYFLGGDRSPWNAFSGSASVVSGGSLPAGAPFPFALTTASSPIGLKTEVIPVVVGKQYLATAWVYSANTSITIAYAWQGHATTFHNFTVTANTWTLVTATDTAPAGATGVAIEYESGGTNLYIQAAIVLPEVPGGLIQAGSITAAQIAAGTITAAQIAASTITVSQLAAGIVYAGIVDGTEIDGAVFRAKNASGATIMTINKSSGTWLLYQDLGSSTQGKLILSGSLNSGTDEFSNAYKAGLTLYDTGTGGNYVQLSFGSPPTTTVGDSVNTWKMDQSFTTANTHTIGNGLGASNISDVVNIPASHATLGTHYIVEVPITGVFEGGVMNFGMLVSVTFTNLVPTTASAFTTGHSFVGTLRFHLQVTAIGAGGTADIWIEGTLSDATSPRSPTDTMSIDGLKTAIAFDTTAAQNFAMGFQWSSSIAGQTITGNTTTVTRRGA